MALNYYLGVKTISDAAKALNKLSFIKVLDESQLQVRITNIDRIRMTAGPASSDNDLSKGIMIVLMGNFTSGEMQEINLLSKCADVVVTNMIVKYIETQAVPLQKKGSIGAIILLRQDAQENVGFGDRCFFCNKTLMWMWGTIVISGPNTEEAMKTSQLASTMVMARKCSCNSCSSIFCVECGNTKGRNLGSRGTHCPKCGTKVPDEQLL